VNKQQWIVAGSGVLLLFGLFFLGRTTPSHKDRPAATTAQDNANAPEGQFSIDSILAHARAELNPALSARVTSLEGSISRGDLKTQKIKLYGDLASLWRDSAHQFLPYLYYNGEKAKLENSDKSLNFAAHSYLEELRGVADPSLKMWMAEQANELFTKSLAIDPNNDSTKIGWGSTYFFGAGKGASPMEGIMKIREVAARDSNNMFAQFMLGYGGIASGQYDKAVERFRKVVRKEPDNKEAIFLLAETLERLGNKAEARQWYEAGKKGVTNPDAVKAIEDKIKSLQ
jgi:tetratricopeptide (TPR) repeat protein